MSSSVRGGDRHEVLRLRHTSPHERVAEGHQVDEVQVIGQVEDVWAGEVSGSPLCTTATD
jgi:hypothetical protein